jgi:predicted nucleic-acid-binding Zn-ribbon protein
MKDKRLKEIVTGNAFGTFVECPKCGSSDLRRHYVLGFENPHAEEDIKEYLRVFCRSCEYTIGEERTKDNRV